MVFRAIALIFWIIFGNYKQLTSKILLSFVKNIVNPSPFAFNLAQLPLTN